ncbi:MAG: L,D-transpeptidase family protein [Pseudomonadota bacterium]
MIQKIIKTLLFTIAFTAYAQDHSEVFHLHDDAERQLKQTIEKVNEQDILEALNLSRNLVEKYPRFKLGQVIYGDLLAIHSNVQPIINKKAIDDIRSEAVARIKFKPKYNNLIPKSIVQLSNNYPYVFLIEAQTYRMYVVKNDIKHPVVVADHYVSIGKKGGGKKSTGDNKTPLGIYTILETLHDDDLPELYGNGAYTLDYPNTWDTEKGYTGYGIWIHGVPRDTYSRPPKDSEGCVVISNAAIDNLKNIIALGKTPVLITNKITWLTPEEWEMQNKQALAVLENWRETWQSLNAESLVALHSTEFKSKNQNYSERKKHIKRITPKKEYIRVEINNIDIFLYPNQKNMFMAKFIQDYESNNFEAAGEEKELYWKLEKDNKWRIILEKI